MRLGLSSKATVDLTDESGPYFSQSTRKSPTYSTEIYKEEERGDETLIEEIIAANLDPNLSNYKSACLCLPPVRMKVPMMIREALFANPSDLLEPPWPKDLLGEGGAE